MNERRTPDRHPTAIPGIVVILVLCALFPSRAHADITSNLSGYWNLDETSGGMAADSSGNNNHGTLTNGPAWTTGKVANGLLFDGVNDYVFVGDPLSLRPANFMTLAAWVNFSNTSANRMIIAKDDSELPSNNTFLRVDTGGAITCSIGGVRVTASTGVVIGQWTHVACTYDGANIRIYVNSALSGSIARSGAIADEAGVGWLIGARTPASPAIFMSGRLDEVRIYSRALSATDIVQLYNVSGPDITPPVRSNGSPSGVLPAGTSQATLTLSTDENATCRFSTTAGTSFGSMTGTFTTTGGLSHSTTVSGLASGNSYAYYVRCQDAALNANTTDFSIAASDVTPPVLSNGAPTGTLSAGTTQTTLSLLTNENATCKYATVAGTTYAAMPNTFSSTGGMSHSTTVAGLTNGTSYTFYVRCRDAALNANTTDFTIAFSVASSDVTPPVLSNGAPTGTLPAGTTQTALSLTTNENATCKYATVAGTTYAAMPNTFSSTGGASHSTTVSGLTNGTSYTFYVRCRDGALNANTTDFTIAFSVAGTGPDILSNLSGYWNLDETAGGIAADSSGNNNHGTLLNGPTWTTGKVGNGLLFDGVNDYISLGDPVSLRPTNFMTLAAWVNFANTSANRMIIAKDDSNPPSNNTFLRVDTGGAVLCSIGGVRVNASTGIIIGQWMHLACTYDGSAVRIYVNGALSGSKVATGPIADEAGIGWLIGARTPASPAIFMSGRLDEVRIYNRALSAADIGSLVSFGGTNPPVDTTPPVLSGGSPSGTLGSGTTSTTLSLTTDESATCKYDTFAGTSYQFMPNTFVTTGGTSHSTLITGLSAGQSYSYFVRCQDAASNANTSDYIISFSVAAITTNPFQDISNWSAFDPYANGVGVAPFGFHGGVFDGTYAYFAPHAAGNKEVMRYDTRAPFNSPSSWAAHDPQAPSGGGGYSEGAFDGRYVYFAPHDNGVISMGEVLRLDTTQPFNSPAAWQTFDPSQNGIGTSPKGYWGALFDGRYVYFSPEWQRVIGEHGEVLRYDTTQSFTSASAWTTFDAGAHGVGTDPDGYKGIISDGSYLYFVPYYNGTASHGEVLRYNLALPFTSTSAWTTYTPANFGVGNIAKGFEGAVTDGRYIYFVPSYSGNGPGAYHGEVLRYDPTLPFNVASSWAAFDPGSNGVGTDPDGYNGAVFDGRYIIFAPSNNGTAPHAEVLRYDTTRPFNSASSWSTFDPAGNGVGTNARGFAGTVYDGRYIYFVPDRNSQGPHDEVLRYDTRP